MSSSSKGSSHVTAPHIAKGKDLISPRAKALNIRFNPDRLSLVPRNEAAVGAFAMLDKVQGEMPEVAMASISLLFASMVSRLGLNPHDQYQMGMKMLTHAPYEKKGNAQIEAMQDLAKQEWLGKEV